jgi:uncharacterized membrane protein
VARVSRRRTPATRVRDDAAVRLVVERPVTLAEVVTAAFTPIRFQGAGHRAVALHLLQTFGRLASLHARRDLHVALLDEAVQVQRAAAEAMRDPADRAAVRAAFGRVFGTLRPDVRRNYDAAAA